jgi:hypothetical protein
MILVISAIFGFFNPILSIPALVLIIIGICGAKSDAGDLCVLLFFIGLGMFIASAWLPWPNTWAMMI